jgi:hypothetical protein
MRSANGVIPVLLAFLIQDTASNATMVQHTGPPCAGRQDITSRLLSEYGEQPVALGLLDDGNLLEVLASPRGSWTILVTHPSRLSCLRASGVAWEMVREVPRPPDGPQTQSRE